MTTTSDEVERREAKTDPVGSAAPTSGEPIAALTEIPPGARLPSNPDEYAYLRDAIDALLATGKKIDGYRDELLSPSGILSQQTEKISRLIDTKGDQTTKAVEANYGLIKSHVENIQRSLDALVPRVAEIEERLEDGVARFDRIENEVAALRNELGVMRERMTSLEAELATYRKNEGNSVTPEPSAPTG